MTLIQNRKIRDSKLKYNIKIDSIIDGEYVNTILISGQMCNLNIPTPITLCDGEHKFQLIKFQTSVIHF